MGSVTNLSSRRRLTDLYIRGQEVSLEDDAVDENDAPEPPIVVWVSKISPLENKEAADRAASARATILAAKYFEDTHEDRIVYLDQLSSIDGREDMINFLIAPKMQEIELSHEAELASEGKWSKDNYYESLREAWAGGLAEKYDEDPKDVDAKKVHAELTKFVNEVEKRVDADRIDMQGEWDIKSDEELRHAVVDRLIESESDYAWLAEFRKWQLFYSVREPNNHKQKYFVAKEEVDSLDPRILHQLVDTFLQLSVDPLEGKDSGETPSS
jgi:hypothetical protein